MTRFTTFTIAFVFVLIGLLWHATPAHAQLGIAGGANFNDIGDIRSEGDQGRFENATGFHVGLFYDLALGPVAVRPGLFYMDVGTFEGEGATEVDIDMVELPIDVRFRLATLPIVRPYLMAGPVFQLAREEDESFDNVNVAANIGLGTEISIPTVSLTLMPELRYAFGISRFTDGFEFAGIEAESGGERLNSFMLRLGVRF
jgi:hypothetical protein